MEFAYFTLDAFFAAIWGLLFLMRPRLRTEMLLMSGCLAILAFIVPFLARDYFHPLYALPIGQWLSVEDILFCFFAGGIASVIYDSLFSSARHQSLQSRRMLFFCALYVSGFAAFLFGTFVLGYPAILLGCLLLVVMGGIQIAIRRDLLMNGLISGLMMMALLVTSYKAWLLLLYPDFLETFITSSLFIAGIPYQEYLWGFAWGFYAGPAYKFAYGLTLGK